MMYYILYYGLVRCCYPGQPLVESSSHVTGFQFSSLLKADRSLYIKRSQSINQFIKTDLCHISLDTDASGIFSSHDDVYYIVTHFISQLPPVFSN